MRAKENKGLFEMKKLFAVMMLLPLMAVANVSTIDGIVWSYTIANGEARLESVAPSNVTGKVAVPLSLGGCPVTRIGRHEFRSGFGCRVFGRCTNLTEVVISSNVTSIGDSAFYGCSGLRKVAIPPSVTDIGRCAFAGCRRLMTFDVNTENQKYSSRNGLLCSKDGSILVFGTNGDVMIPQEVKSIGDYAFRGCEELRTVVMSTGVKKIGNSAFQGCIELKSVDIPSSVTSIGWYAFNDCNELMSFIVDEANIKYSSRDGMLCSKDGATLVYGVNGDVEVPTCVRKIGRYAFAGCRGLKSVKIPETVKSIEDSAFRLCSGLMTLSIPAGVTDIAGGFWGCTGLMSFEVSEGNPVYRSINRLLCSKDGRRVIRGVGGDVVIPSGVVSVEAFAFSSCSGLRTVKFPETVKSIGRGAFKQCTGLTRVTIPAGVTNIGESAFDSCENLTSIDLPSGVKRIEHHAFVGCFRIQNVVIPEGVTHIGDMAFAWCAGLESIFLPASVESIGDSTFVECWSLKKIAIPSGVTRIGRGAFYKCSELKSVDIPSSVTSIGNGAFGRTPFYQSMPDGPIVLGGGVLCKYKGECPSSVTIPPNVTSIGECAFVNCSNLTAMTIPTAVTNIDGHAFVNCPKLKSICVIMKDGGTEEMAFDKWFSPWKNVVVQRLKKCEILINEQFKRDAKTYLCLFSASWAGLCRKEMARIATIYAEVLLSDPDIELIHFSCDYDKGCALSWAKEINAKFPVINPEGKATGANPLNLQPAGLPYMFIIKADGTLVEHGPPSSLFTKEKIGKYLGEKSKLAWEDVEKSDKKDFRKSQMPSNGSLLNRRRLRRK